MIKSGGEWISSIELENIAMNHPEVRPSSLDRTQSRIPFCFVSPLRIPATEEFSSSTQCELLYIEMLLCLLDFSFIRLSAIIRWHWRL